MSIIVACTSINSSEYRVCQNTSRTLYLFLLLLTVPPLLHSCHMSPPLLASLSLLHFSIFILWLSNFLLELIFCRTRDRQRDRETDRERDRKKERQRGRTRYQYSEWCHIKKKTTNLAVIIQSHDTNHTHVHV